MKNYFILALVGFLSISGCRGQQQIPFDSDEIAGPSCPQEMCVFVFDRLEEQWLYLRNLEDALRRTVSLLSSISSNEQLSGANFAAFKADPIILAFLQSEPTASRPPRSSGWEVDPVIPLSESKDWIESSKINNHERKKRHVDSADSFDAYLSEPALTPRERVAHALKWAKTGSSSRKEFVDPLMNDDPKVAAVQQHGRKSRKAAATNPSDTEQKLNGTTKEYGFDMEVANKNATSLSSQTFSSESVEKNTSMNTGSALLGTTLSSDNQIDLAVSTKDYVNEKLSSLQDAIQCALAQLNKDNVSESMGIVTNSQATLDLNNYLTVQFDLRTCRKHLTAVWYRISAKKDIINLQNSGINTDNGHLQTFLQVPKHCLMETSDNTFSITLPATEQGADGCSFPLMVLEECKVYSVDIIPIYLALQGQSATVDVTTQPMLANSTNMKSVEVMPSQNSTHSLNVQWSIESEDCAQLLTSVDVRIYRDSSDSIFSTYTIPIECFTNYNNNLFSTALSSFGNNGAEKCREIAWRPLDICRDYYVEVQPEYASSQLKGRSLSKEMFTSGQDSSKCCYMLSQSTGQFQSINHDNNFECSWLIAVEDNHNIWLTFTEFQLESSYYHIQVYDGPYSTSPLILDRSGYQAPPSLRSSTNKLFVKLVSQYYYRQSYGKQFKAHYAAVEESKTPYIPGCGGYITGSGDISKSAYPLSDYNSTECLWYLQSSDLMSTIVINSNSDGTSASFPMIIYDGWTNGGRVIYNQTSGSLKTVVYSLTNRALIRFPAWNMENRERAYSWNIKSLNTQQCSYNYSMSNSGNIKSPNYPYNYNGLMDCRWTISVNSSSKIQLTFAFFETKQNYDFVTIYDGESIFSPLLNELSGRIDNPVFSITSSANFMTVRFATYVNNQKNNNYDYYNRPQPSIAGFLAIYSAIRCDASEINNVITPVPPTKTTTESPDWVATVFPMLGLNETIAATHNPTPVYTNFTLDRTLKI